MRALFRLGFLLILSFLVGCASVPVLRVSILEVNSNSRLAGLLSHYFPDWFESREAKLRVELEKQAAKTGTRPDYLDLTDLSPESMDDFEVALTPTVRLKLQSMTGDLATVLELLEDNILRLNTARKTGTLPSLNDVPWSMPRITVFQTRELVLAAGQSPAQALEAALLLQKRQLAAVFDDYSRLFDVLDKTGVFLAPRVSSVDFYLSL